MTDVRTDLVEAIRTALQAHADPGTAATQQAYMKSAMPYLGLPNPVLTKALRPVLADPTLRLATRAEWEATVRALWDQATHREEWYAAIALTGHRAYSGWQDPATVSLYQHLITTGAWWDVVDVLGSRRVGPILLAHPQDETPRMRQWAVDDDLWLRRSAIISQLTFKDRTDTDLLQDALDANLEDSASGSIFWIRKAVGWALRQYARTDPGWVRAYVAARGDRLAGLSRREALKHL